MSLIHYLYFHISYLNIYCIILYTEQSFREILNKRFEGSLNVQNVEHDFALITTQSRSAGERECQQTRLIISETEFTYSQTLSLFCVGIEIQVTAA